MYSIVTYYVLQIAQPQPDKQFNYEFDRSAKCDGYLLGGNNNSIAYLAPDFIKEHGLTVPRLHQHFVNNGEDSGPLDSQVSNRRVFDRIHCITNDIPV